MNPDPNLLVRQTPDTPLPTDDWKQSLFKLFLHVNRDLTPFQVECLKAVFGPHATLRRVQATIGNIRERMEKLKAAGWKPNNETTDAILNPAHYDRFPMEPTYFIVEAGGFHWNLENFLKYIVRFPFKNGIEDLGKAARNLTMFALHVQGSSEWSR